MIKYETRSNFEYKCSFGTVIADKVRIAISDTNGEEFLPSEEIDRLTRMAIEKFYQENYAKLLLGERVEISRTQLMTLMSWMGLSAEQLGKVIGYKKSKISKVLTREKSKRQGLSSSAKMVLFERIGMELNQPGLTKTLGAGDAKTINEKRLKLFQFKVVDKYNSSKDQINSVAAKSADEEAEMRGWAPGYEVRQVGEVEQAADGEAIYHFEVIGTLLPGDDGEGEAKPAVKKSKIQ